MPNNRPYKVSRGRAKKSSGLLGVLLMLVAAAVISLLIALIWQAFDKSNPQPNIEKSQISQAAPAPSEVEKASSSMPASSSEPESEPEKTTAVAGPLPESPRVNSSYFDDAVFVGDSVTEGMLYCDFMKNTRILAGTSINFSTVSTAQVIKLADGTRTTIMDELGKQLYKKVYVMLGGNEVRDQTKETFIERYSVVLDEIKAKQPNAIIYVQSMTPVTKNNNYNMDNKRIDEFNLAVMQLAHEKDMYYLNIAESLKNDEGMLPTEASPADGMHFGPNYFEKWFSYLKVHVAPGSATEAELKKAPATASSGASSDAASEGSSSSGTSTSNKTSSAADKSSSAAS